MFKLFVALQLLWVSLMAPIDRAHDTLRRARRDERGSVTIEQVIWAVALIVIAGTVVAAITAYVDTKKNQIK